MIQLMTAGAIIRINYFVLSCIGKRIKKIVTVAVKMGQLKWTRLGKVSSVESEGSWQKRDF